MHHVEVIRLRVVHNIFPTIGSVPVAAYGAERASAQLPRRSMDGYGNISFLGN